MLLGQPENHVRCYNKFNAIELSPLSFAFEQLIVVKCDLKNVGRIILSTFRHIWGFPIPPPKIGVD